MSEKVTTIWLFDSNRRIYPKPEPGRIYSSAPIWREHWAPHAVVGETSRSWLLEYGAGKVAKKRPPNVLTSPCFSQLEVDQRCWVNEHRRHLGTLVDHTADYAELHRVAQLFAYRDEVYKALGDAPPLC